MAINRLASVENSGTAPASRSESRPLRDSVRLHAAYALYLASASWLAASVLLRFPSRRNQTSDLRAREIISRHSSRYLVQLGRMGCIRCEYVGFKDSSNWRGSLLCANHPSIFDALLLFQNFPHAACVVGTNPWRHPLFSIPARQAAYIPSLPALRMVKETRRVVSEGGNMIFFPRARGRARGNWVHSSMDSRSRQSKAAPQCERSSSSAQAVFWAKPSPSKALFNCPSTSGFQQARFFTQVLMKARGISARCWRNIFANA